MALLRPSIPAIFCLLVLCRPALADDAAPAVDRVEPGLDLLSDTAPAGARLAGLDLGYHAKSDGRLYFTEIQPLYTTGAGDPLPGKPFVLTHGKPRHIVAVARPGYVVTAAVLHYSAENMLDGCRLTFTRLAGEKLDPADTYPGPWVGAKGDLLLDAHDQPITGLRFEAGRTVHTLTLITPAGPVAPATRPAQPGSTPTPDRAGPRPFVKSQTSIKGLFVFNPNPGVTQDLGFAGDRILTVSAGKNPDGRVELAGSGKIGADMRAALDEAVRAVKVRHPDWEQRKLVISFEDKYSPKDGGSGATGFALLLLSAIDGWDIDPHFAITGDLSADGKVRKVTAVDAKLRGAATDGCAVVAIPAANADRVADYLVLESPDALADLQVFSVADLTDAVDLARADRPEPLARAIDRFAEFQASFKAAPRTYLATPDARQCLRDVLDLAPNHLSARYLLLCADGKQPKRLSTGYSLYRMSLAVLQFHESLKDAKALAKKFPESAFADAAKQLRSFRATTAEDALPALAALTDYVDGIQRLARHAMTEDELARRFDTYRQALARLQTNPDTMGRILREGF